MVVGQEWYFANHDQASGPEMVRFSIKQRYEWLDVEGGWTKKPTTARRRYC